MPYLSSFDHVTDIPTFPEFPVPITVKPILPEIQEAIINSRANSARKKRDRASATPTAQQKPASETHDQSASAAAISADEHIESEVMLNLRERHGSPAVPGTVKTKVLQSAKRLDDTNSASSSRPTSSSKSHVHSAVYPPSEEEFRKAIYQGTSGIAASQQGRQTLAVIPGNTTFRNLLEDDWVQIAVLLIDVKIMISCNIDYCLVQAFIKVVQWHLLLLYNNHINQVTKQDMKLVSLEVSALYLSILKIRMGMI